MSKRDLWPAGAALLLWVIFAPGVDAQVIPIPPKPAPGQVTPIAPAAAPDGVVSVFAIGVAPVVGGNAKAARAVALQAAYAEAVGRGAGIEVGRLTVLRNIRTISDVVASQSRGFIRRYDIVGEGLTQDSPPAYEVRIRADVSTGATDESSERHGLKLFLELLGNPTLLVLLPDAEFSDATTAAWLRVQHTPSSTEITTGRTDQRTEVRPGLTVLGADRQAPGMVRVAEMAVAQAFVGFGYQVLTSDDLAANDAIDTALLSQARRGVTRASLDIARLVGADVLLSGTLTLSAQKVAPMGVEYVSATTVAAAKALVVSNGYVVDAFHRQVTKAHTSALGAASMTMSDIADAFAAALAWKIPSLLVAQPRITDVRIDGVDLALTQQFKAALEAIEGIEAVRVESIPTVTRSVGVLRLFSSQVLPPVDALLAAVQAATTKPVVVTSADKFTLVLSIR